jgi:predicted flap endonuclease-1-like 5' DNA nuclease
MSYPITDIHGIEADVATALKKAGIRTTGRLLDSAAKPKDRKSLAEKTGLPEKSILCWANMADRMRIKGVGEDYAVLLQAAGVDTVKELKYRNPARLAKAMAEANSKRKLVRVLPSDQAVVRWIEHAKKLQLKIKY